MQTHKIGREHMDDLQMTTSKKYTFAILGKPTKLQRMELKESIERLIGDFSSNISENTEVVGTLNLSKSTSLDVVVVAYYAKNQKKHLDEVSHLLSNKCSVIPIVQPLLKLTKSVPKNLQDVFGFELILEDSPMEIAASMLECAGLLSVKRMYQP